MSTPEDDDDASETARQRRIADACMGTNGAVGGRLGLYRKLVQNNLATVARRLLPRTTRALDDVGPREFEAWFARFLAEAGPTTPYLRDVPLEFVRWATPLWRGAPVLPPFVSDLARFEMDLFEVEAAPKAADEPVAEVALDRALVFATPRKLASYAYPVHALDRSTAAHATHLLLHRDRDNEIHVLPVDPGKRALLEWLLEGRTVTDALARANTASLEETARWLAQLGEAGALLGGAG